MQGQLENGSMTPKIYEIFTFPSGKCAKLTRHVPDAVAGKVSPAPYIDACFVRRGLDEYRKTGYHETVTNCYFFGNDLFRESI